MVALSHAYETAITIFFQEAEVPITFPCLILQQLVYFLKMNKIKKGREPGKRQTEAKAFKSSKVKETETRLF